MITRGTTRAALTIAVAATLVQPVAARAQAAGCAADTRLATSMRGTLARSITISARQVQLLLRMVSLESAQQPVPAGVVADLRTKTNRNARVLARGERELRSLPPGTPQGRAFKQLGLRYLHGGLRSMNACLLNAAEAKTAAQLGASVTCFDNARRKSAALESSINTSLTRLARTKRCTLRS